MCRVDGFDTDMLRQQANCRFAAKANAAPKVAFANDGLAVGLVATTIFYFGYAYADLRERFSTGGEA